LDDDPPTRRLDDDPPTRRFAAAQVAVLAVVLVLAGCTSVSGSRPGSSAPASASVIIDISPAGKDARPDMPIVVTARGGRIRSVTVSAEGAVIAGAVDASGTTWRSVGSLAPRTTYQVAVTAADPAGNTATRNSSIRTLVPAKTATSTITPANGRTVGVGMPVVVDFSRSVTRRQAVTQAIQLSSTPAVQGTWRWISAKQVQWRPATFWPSGTTVTVTVPLSAVEVSPGVWGGSTRRSTFMIGDAMVTTVDVVRHRMTVRRNGKVIATFPVTTGKAGFRTRNGTKVVMSRQLSVRMNSTSVGIGPQDPESYNLVVRWAMRLTSSGEFIHAAPWSVASHGRANVSHGCTGLSERRARWLYGRSKVGDVVIYTGSQRRPERGNGYTAWNMSYSQWTSEAD
jgi:lipoprotein-anchoring transpeptidase ErfK/SrfK